MSLGLRINEAVILFIYLFSWNDALKDAVKECQVSITGRGFCNKGV